MTEGLDVIIVDDEPDVCHTLAALVSRFYTWGDVLEFTDADEAIEYCLNREVGIAIFVVDVYLSGKSGFFFLDAIEEVAQIDRKPKINGRFLDAYISQIKN